MRFPVLVSPGDGGSGVLGGVFPSDSSDSRAAHTAVEISPSAVSPRLPLRSDSAAALLSPLGSGRTEPDSHSGRSEVSRVCSQGLSRSAFQALNNGSAAASGCVSEAGLPHEGASHLPRLLRILIVDDTATNRRVLSRALRLALQPAGDATWDVTFVEVADGIAGLEALGFADTERVSPAAASPASFDVCLLDAEMPRMGGYEMVATLRSRGCSVPVIGITGNALPEDVGQFLAAGAQAVVTKPVRISELMAQLRCWVPAFSASAASERQRMGP